MFLAEIHFEDNTLNSIYDLNLLAPIQKGNVIELPHNALIARNDGKYIQTVYVVTSATWKFQQGRTLKEIDTPILVLRLKEFYD